MKVVIYNLIGGASLFLGILGVFLPLLPSTCFILLATWAFSKSSPVFHNWLLHDSPFSHSIQNWQRHRVIPTKIKWIASISIVVSYAITLTLVSNAYVLTALALGLVGLLAFILSKPGETVIESNYQQIHELHQPVTQIRVS